MGTTGLVALHSGRGDSAAALLVLLRAGALALLLAGMVALSRPLWQGLGLLLMAPATDIAELAGSYMAIRIWSAPAVLATYAITGWFIGQRNTRWPLVFMVLSNGVNIVLDLWFVFGLGLASDGAALATVIAEYAGLALALYAVWRQLGRQLPARALCTDALRLAGMAPLLRNNRDLFLRTLCLLLSFAFFVASGDKLGAATLAANAIMLQLLMLSAFALDGFAYAAEALCGHSAGAGDREGFVEALWGSALWCAASAALISLSLALGFSALAPLLTGLPEVTAIMQTHAAWLVALPLIAAPAYWLDGVFIGTARTRPMMTTMIVALLLVFLPLWWWSAPLGNHGLWLALTAFNGARGLLLGGVFWQVWTRGEWVGAPAK
jgi:multidrug resistance protein, MATE family